jgi:diaminopimelate epimerase
MQEFYKYHGAGNDFILIDNRTKSFAIDNEQIKAICNRRLGIGADGLILLNSSDLQGTDFEMQYFNSDGFEGSMCGNGGRCAVAFAKQLQIIVNQATFLGIDGVHTAAIISSEGNKSEISIQMKDVQEIISFDDGYFLDTGSPHFVKFVDNLANMNILEEGRNIRYDSRFKYGTNVNFVEIQDKNTIFVRTFERGVEDETLSCGTGVTASALVFANLNTELQNITVKTLGGKFSVNFNRELNKFSHIYLQGETCFVFKGCCTFANR